MSFLYGLSLTLVIAVIVASIFEKLRFLPSAGFLLAGFIVKMISLYIAPNLFMSFDVYGFGYYLLVISSILIAFEMGREIGSTGFDPKVVSFIALETTLIMILSISILRAFGLALDEAISVGIALLSSSSTTVYVLTRDVSSSTRSIALSITLLEDIALLTMLSLVRGRGSNPLITLTLTVLMALIGSIIFRYLSRIFYVSRYPYILSIAIALAYAGVAESFASPYLGAFVAGYIIQRNIGSINSSESFTSIAVLLYMLSIGMVFPYINIFRLHIFILVIILSLISIAIRAIAVFLTSLIILGDAREATIISLRMTSISELAPLVALTAVGGGITSHDIAVALVLMPIATIAIAPIIASRSSGIADTIGRYIKVRKVFTRIDDLYRILSDIVYTSIKIVGILIAIAIVTTFLSYIALASIPISVYALYRYYKQLSDKIDKLYSGIGIVARYIVRFFIVLALSLLTVYILTTLSETIQMINILRPYLPIAIPIVIAVIVIDMAIEIMNRYRLKSNQIY
ncbi:transporter, CPA2 family (2.A.37) [Ignisphaera aggregans DSM 17230]|uniref:Transporter, CPA2 family (2.A.37) n=1 Tax=Ignisphaera aggregans (strain DSM 17230 / JCM 13409 / AQ1.S1) TaxID=583356 RepID=E0STS8_IGNAA|nr:transporter, CPA2 family (2.A.37) [Ignisphaera aggregans DSM 17230]